FAYRVKGLGERGDEFWDAHEPMYPHTTDGMIEYNRQQSEKPNALHPMWHPDGKNPEYVETPDGDGEQEP
ncbi:MAG: hypothetical protein M3434_07870, partial [Gemmatimonadota bacterium]|nr:hypothetical protein [Gemmatimonadota bacterium]